MFVMTCIDRANFENALAYSSERAAAEEKTKEMGFEEMFDRVRHVINSVERSTARRSYVTRGR